MTREFIGKFQSLEESKNARSLILIQFTHYVGG